MHAPPQTCKRGCQTLTRACLRYPPHLGGTPLSIRSWKISVKMSGFSSQRFKTSSFTPKRPYFTLNTPPQTSSQASQTCSLECFRCNAACLRGEGEKKRRTLVREPVGETSMMLEVKLSRKIE